MNLLLSAAASDNLLLQAVNIFIKYKSLFWYGVKITLLISLTGTVIGLLVGLVVGGLRAMEIEPRDPAPVKLFKKLWAVLSTIYVEFFRGTPMIVQAVFMYYGLKPMLHWEPIPAAIFIISINTGSYMAEIIRAGIQSVDKGQIEAARSIGMTSIQTMRYVVMPQAIKNSFPSIGNEFVVNIKDSSVLNAISVTELYFQSNSIAGSIFKFKETFLVTCFIYLILTFTTTRILYYIEKRLRMPRSSFPASQTVNEVNHL
ncbi:MAG: amino acid ABC transporter permease [Oscillospiraceae bacterium]|nr:amino acid ABC transporter permease [Oscillospiraceae bacterium]